MKVLFVVASYYPDGAGAGMSVRHLAEGMVQSGHEVSVLRIARDGQSKTETVNGVKIIYRPIWNIYNLGGAQRPLWKRLIWHTIDSFNPVAAFDFWRILRKEKPDIINTSIIAGFSTSVFTVAKLMGIPVVHTMRDYYMLCPQNGMFNNGHSCTTICNRCKPFKMVRSVMAHQVDMFLSNSGYVETVHKKHKGIPEKTSSLVQYNMNSDDHIDPPRSYVQDRPFIFGFIGRLDTVKGVHVLLEAVKKIKNENWELHIAGDGSEVYKKYLREILDDPRVIYVGYVDADNFYEKIDALVCPSLYGEPLPRVVYEAYRKALPVIAAKTGGTPEIVDHGDCGYLYQAHDTNALYRFMEQLMSSPDIYEHMSRQACQKAQGFTKSAITEAFAAKLETALKASKSAD